MDRGYNDDEMLTDGNTPTQKQNFRLCTVFRTRPSKLFTLSNLS